MKMQMYYLFLISCLFNCFMILPIMKIECAMARGLHVKCRDTVNPYFRSAFFRFPVDETKVPWDVPFVTYDPPDYTSESLKGQSWADLPDPSTCNFNVEDDEGVIRTSEHGKYKLDTDGRPLNPFGRTGLRGRGTFGKWGPNHAGDAIVSRFSGGKLHFVAIERHDTGEFALPGGMVDKGEKPLEAVIREFREEVLGNQRLAKLDDLWKRGQEVYKGYVDDHRNTDNAWTLAVNFHDTDGLLDDVELKGGDDAKSAQWVAVSKNLCLYASHKYLVYLFAKMHGIDLNTLE